MKKNISCFLIIVSVLLLLVQPALSENTPIQFESKMMASISSQIREATDLTLSEDTRAVLAALLTLEFQTQEPDVKIDFTSPIYVSKSGTMAAVSFNTTKGYVLVIYQMNPLTTYYSFADSSDSTIAKKALEISSDEVWEVTYDLYLEKLTALVQQIQ